MSAYSAHEVSAKMLLVLRKWPATPYRSAEYRLLPAFMLASNVVFCLDCLVNELSEMYFTQRVLTHFLKPNLRSLTLQRRYRAEWVWRRLSYSEGTGLCLVGPSGLACRIGVVEGPQGDNTTGQRLDFLGADSNGLMHVLGLTACSA
jgi:hypothetical protein